MDNRSADWRIHRFERFTDFLVSIFAGELRHVLLASSVVLAVGQYLITGLGLQVDELTILGGLIAIVATVIIAKMIKRSREQQGGQ